ncbi:hypothetical protein D3C72_2534550 [compost metagenome]
MASGKVAGPPMPRSDEYRSATPDSAAVGMALWRLSLAMAIASKGPFGSASSGTSLTVIKPKSM